MIYGYPHYMHNNNNNFNALFTASNHQLSLMKVNPISIDTDDHNTTYWLQDVASNTQFATSFYSGGPHLAAASGILGVRPVFAITA